jgi:hypothetical protein
MPIIFQCNQLDTPLYFKATNLLPIIVQSSKLGAHIFQSSKLGAHYISMQQTHVCTCDYSLEALSPYSIKMRH